MRFPPNLPRGIRQAMRPLLASQERDERQDGLLEAGGDVPSTLYPEIPEIIYGKIRSETGSGSGGGSGQLEDFPGAGFFDVDGRVAYSFDQVVDDEPWKGTLIRDGVSTSIKEDMTGGSNFAYPLQDDADFEVGDIIVLMRKKGIHWAILFAVRAGAGSGGGRRRYRGSCFTNPDGTTGFDLEEI